MRAEADEARAQLAEIVAGVKRAPVLAEQIATDLDLKLRGAIVLAVVASVYPRSMKESALLDGYELARRELDYGKVEINDEIMRTNIKHLRSTFAARNWCDPISAGISIGEGAGSRRLTDPGAVFLNDRFGSPRTSLIVAAREMAA